LKKSQWKYFSLEKEVEEIRLMRHVFDINTNPEIIKALWFLSRNCIVILSPTEIRINTSNTKSILIKSKSGWKTYVIGTGVVEISHYVIIDYNEDYEEGFFYVFAKDDRIKIIETLKRALLSELSRKKEKAKQEIEKEINDIINTLIQYFSL